MRILLLIALISISTESFAKMILPNEIKRGPIVKDVCGSFQDGVQSLERLQDTSSFDAEGQIAVYLFSARALAALYKQKMLMEKNKKRKALYKQKFELACQNAS